MPIKYTNQLITNDVVPVNAPVTDDIRLSEALSRLQGQFNHSSLFGWYDYSDLATQTTPISVTGTVQTKITCDGLGGIAPQNYPISGITDVYNTTSQQFDFSDLSLGDTVNIDFDLYVTTSAPSQEFTIGVSAAIGGAFPFEKVASPFFKKTAGLKHVTGTIKIKMFNASTRDNPAELFIISDDDCTVEVVGWNVEVIRPNT